MPTRAPATQIQAEFDEIARLLPRDDEPGPYEEWLFENLPRRRETALELGCGTGRVSRELAKRFATTTGVDFSAGMIEEARRRTPAGANLQFVRADLFEFLAQATERYDCIVSVATLHHTDFATALQAMARALRPGGRLLVIDLYEQRNPLLNAIASLVALTRFRFNFRLRRAFRRHGSNETYLTLDEVRRIASAELPGAVVEGRLLWRYTLRWEKSA